ncbi:hypothetical protein M9Y10_000305 [Tritrichomonas musculus]|uniref:Coil containing protein n=1 Tax=Tritrichomonas musculus TaxID=1915356 RepID=A0ABR2L3V5_9EUKA
MSESVLVSKQLEQKLIRVLEQKEENEIEFERIRENFQISCGYRLMYREGDPIPFCQDSNKDDEKVKSRLIQCRFDEEIYDLEILKLKDKIAEAKIAEIQDINEL